MDFEEVEPGELDELMDQSETMSVGDDDGEETGFGNDVDTAVAVDFNETTHTKKGNRSKRRSVNTKQKWTVAEEEEIKTLFQTFFDQKVRPLPKHCLKAIRISKKKGGVIWHRKKDVLKKKVFRMVESLKNAG